MIDIQYVVAFAAAVVNLFKKSLRADLVPICTVCLAVLLNLLNALIGGGNLIAAGQEAFVAAGIAVALFVGGDAARKYSASPFKTVREQKEIQEITNMKE